MKRSLWSVVRIVFGLAGVAFLVVAFIAALRRPDVSFPSWTATVPALAAVAAGLVFAAQGWIALFDEPALGRALAHGFYVSQLAKYIPGMIWQAVALVESARRAGLRLSRASAGFPVFALTQVAAGGTFGLAFAAFGAHLSPLARAGAVAGLIPVAMLNRRWMIRVLEIVARLMKRTIPPDTVPSQSAILRSYSWSVGTLLLSGLGFAALMSSVGTERSVAFLVAAFAVAWTVGFLALPFPSGVGIREAVLIAAASSGAAAPVVSAAVAHRLVTMAAELVLAGATTFRAAHSRTV